MAKKGKYVYVWPRPMVTVDMVVFGLVKNKAKLLLITRKKEPFKGKWALPGGFVGINEELEDSAVRELAEETSLTDIQLEQIHTFGECGKDPRGRQITVTYMGIITKGLNKIKAGDDAAEVKWFDIEDLPTNLAFNHNKVARFAIRKLKRKNIYRQLVVLKKNHKAKKHRPIF